MEWLSSNWQGSAIGSLISKRPYNQTGVNLSTLKKLMKSLTKVPEDFVLHKEIQKIIDYRKKCLETGTGINFAFSEALAFGALMTKFTPLKEDKKDVPTTVTKDLRMEEHPTVHVRLSGQDSVRGTFNQRHSAIFCQKTTKYFIQLNNLDMGEQAKISVANSSLSEEAILGFEYGYSLSNDMALVLWESQFGDFANGAQTMIDCFIASGESKWQNQSSLVMLLPHGYDGQGPDHSSGRLERFLQLVDDDPDQKPGQGRFSLSEMEAGFDTIDKNKVGFVTLETFTKAIRNYTQSTDERVELTIAEIITELQDLGLISTKDDGTPIFTKESWCKLMSSWLQSNSERRHNLVIVVPSTPAQYFHCLRRQIHRPFNKPLIVMSAKWLLHHRACVSHINDMTTGTFFQRIILEGGRGDNMSRNEDYNEEDNKEEKNNLLHPLNIRRVLFCSGKVFYHLYHARHSMAIKDITIIRVEQIAPFPYDLIGPAIARFPNADLVWTQEEPKNQGAWGYVKPRFDTAMREAGIIDRPNIRYVGRKPSSSSAVGSYHIHDQEQKAFIKEALS